MKLKLLKLLGIAPFILLIIISINSTIASHSMRPVGDTIDNVLLFLYATFTIFWGGAVLSICSHALEKKWSIGKTFICSGIACFIILTAMLLTNGIYYFEPSFSYLLGMVKMVFLNDKHIKMCEIISIIMIVFGAIYTYKENKKRED